MVASIRKSNLADPILAFTRLVVGLIFAVDGIGRLLQIRPWGFSIDAVGLYLWTYGVPYSMTIALGISIIEAVGGVFLLLGLSTRYAAAVLTFVFTAIAVLIHGPGSYPWESMSPIYATSEITGILIIASLMIALHGPGRLHLSGVVTQIGRSSVPSEDAETYTAK